jgi:hypothetical protein
MCKAWPHDARRAREQELAEALAQPLQPGFSMKYFTGRPAAGDAAADAADAEAPAAVALAQHMATSRRAAASATAAKARRAGPA